MKLNLGNLFKIAKKLAPVVIPMIPYVKAAIKEVKAEQKAKSVADKA